MSLFNLFKRNNIRCGDKLFLSGGYDQIPRWLLDGDGHKVTVIKFLKKADNNKHYCITKLSKKITVDNITGDIVTLELCFGDTWMSTGTARVFLSSRQPNAENFLNDKAQYVWVESHASYKRI